MCLWISSPFLLTASPYTHVIAVGVFVHISCRLNDSSVGSIPRRGDAGSQGMWVGSTARLLSRKAVPYLCSHWQPGGFYSLKKVILFIFVTPVVGHLFPRTYPFFLFLITAPWCHFVGITSPWFSIHVIQMELTMLSHILVWPCDWALANQHLASPRQSSEGTWLNLGQIRANPGPLLELLGERLPLSLGVELSEAITATVSGEKLLEGEGFTKESTAEKWRLSLDVPLEPTMPEADLHWSLQLHKPINSFSVEAHLSWV